jgi:Zn/Cd-binding protein ZinT
MKPSNLEAATPYLHAVARRRLKESEEEIEALRGILDNSEWNRGYFKALEGLLLTLRSNDGRYLYLQRIKIDEKIIKKLKEEFKKHSTNELHADYDKGYFTALTDYTMTLEEVKPWNNPETARETELDSEVSSEESPASTA